MPATTWKILNKNSPGTSSTFGADDWDMPGRYMNDIDLTATAPSSVKTNTSYWDNRLRVWNPAKTFSYNIRSSALLANRDITLPLLSSADEVAMLMHTSEFQNKTINSDLNTLRNTTNAIGDLLVGNGTKYTRLPMGSTGGYALTIKNDLTGLEWTPAVSTNLDALSDTVISTPANGQVLTYNGTNWVNSASAAGSGIANRNYDLTVYKEGSNFVCRDEGGTIVSGPTATPETPLAYLFNNLAEYESGFVGSGIYQLTGAFTGFTIDQRRIGVDFAPGTVIRVPVSYSGFLFKFAVPSVGESLYQVRFRGGFFAEAGTPGKAWTCFYLHNTSTGADGLHDIWISDAQVQNAGVGIKLDHDDADAWINGNWFVNLSIRTSKKVVEFEGVAPAAGGGFDRNNFIGIHAQSEPTDSLGGILNVRGNQNRFIDCDIWDVPDAQNQIEITSSASYTEVQNGILGLKKVTDNGVLTRWDNPREREENGPFGTDRKTGEVFGINTSGAAQSSGLLGDLINYSSTGVSQSASRDNDSTYGQYNTGTTANSVAGIRTQYIVARIDHLPALLGKFQMSDAGQNSRFFVLFSSTGSAITGTNSILDNQTGFGFGFRTGAALNPFEIFHNNGSATGTILVPPYTVARDTNVHTIRFIADSITNLRYRIDENPWKNITLSGHTGANLFLHVIVSNSGGSDINLKIKKLKIWTN